MKKTMRCLLAASLASLGGCISLSPTAPAKQYYVLDARRVAPRDATPATPGVLRVNLFRAAPDVTDPGLGVRLDDTRLEHSLRFAFLAPPAALVGAQARQWLSDAGLFSAVVDADGAASNRYELDGLVIALGADLRDPAAPKAVLELQLTLVDDTTPGGAPVFQRTYRREAPLPDRTPAAILRGLDAALTQVLAAVEQDLRAAIH